MSAALPRRLAATSAGPVPRVVGPADVILTAAVIALVAFGVVMVFSASAVRADQAFGDPAHYLVRQAIFALVGVFTMLFVARIDYHRYRPLTYPVLGVSVFLMLVVAFGFGRSAGGAARWIALGPINIQPAEAATLALVLWLAYSLSKKAERIKSFEVGFLPHALMAGFLMLLCLKQPDFGSAVMIGLLTFTLLFAAGARLGYLLGAVLLAAPVAYLLIATSPYRMRRIRAFLAPFEHRMNEGYQVFESLISFGAGGVTGVGIGDGRQKLFFLPEAHTDFIGAIVAEELGFVGTFLLIAIFAVVVARGFRVAYRAADDYGSYLAVGISTFLGHQAFTNLAVAMGMLPTKGLVLPFISYGGSSLLVNCAACGLLLNVSRPREGALDEDAAHDDARTSRRSRPRRGAAARRRPPSRQALRVGGRHG